MLRGYFKPFLNFSSNQKCFVATQKTDQTIQLQFMNQIFLYIYIYISLLTLKERECEYGSIKWKKAKVL